MQAQIVWFKRDLRVTDHRPLVYATQLGPVLPLYVDEPELWSLPDVSARHRLFVADALGALRTDLEELRLTLCVMHGTVERALQSCRDAFGDFTLWSHQETGNAWTFTRDKRVADWCRDRGIAWREIPQNGVIRGLRKRDGWAARWERRMAEPICERPSTVMGALAPLEEASESRTMERTTLQQRGTRGSGDALLTSFLFERGRGYQRGISSPLTAEQSCSRTSSHLAYGLLSLREIVHATRRRIDTIDPTESGAATWRRSLKSFLSRLHWHCHFMQKLETQPSIEFQNMHRAFDGLRDSTWNEGYFTAWKRGETGIPFVDACMRSLIATGWINFRMRAMLCAFSSYHLWLHWRKPSLYLAGLFTDYEPGIHISQMQMQSGTTGINTIRIYNPVKQGLDQDPQGTFIRRWCPELARLPDYLLHQPWLGERSLLATYHVRLGEVYPHPIIDHIEAARHARDAVWGVHRNVLFASEVDAIEQMHGSRKSGFKQMTQKRHSGTKRSDDRSLPLPFEEM